MYEAAKVYEESGKVVLTVQNEAVKVTRTTWRRVAMIVLHGAVSIGVVTGGLRGPVPAQYFAMY